MSDTGVGIPAEDLPRIFDRYWHKDQAKGGGTGLGLYICQAIVQAHRGKLQVESTAGAGTTFCFALPTIPPERRRAR